jgi:putative transcriptional regulator
MRSLLRRIGLSLLLLTGPAAGAAPAVGQAWESTAGKLLVAQPTMRDPRFRRTIVFMAVHTRRGALGFIINRVAARRPLRRYFWRYGLPETGVDGSVNLHFGGPVGLRRSTVLHPGPYRHPRSVRLRSGVYVTAPRFVFGDLNRRRGPKRFLLLAGRAGWSPGQLEREISAGAWAVIPFDRNLVFDPDQSGKWQKALERRGVDL